ncbi:MULTISPECIES: rhomboid family intramembrane serine protease [Marivita]|uniref:Rhomboid family intramembrane serine protease n=1 Tax=Marivita cryptomonadis TaxID=505252 RepID=A0A9Q2NR11_9RHOB|nr:MULTISPECIES: rhomboid family intramembrane serine protease [Marivita]MBM2319797.1 rhomboid family intramembrane serine protease [Marivita cryptomonadis]MBM2329376.1 rhomboid family intramembrane serine protease [Marivita cryptomonadis]MBM2338964.1 rhomboid family intramembrane serine protease [Marivita cryptomonadis]MBM2343622.1 rhomboid family intramembrane serine protease [Marivita cryptomonadis]MBM2348299.1 rhomboid family intramembrane serine protease [Marivita cryptomonadis]
MTHPHNEPPLNPLPPVVIALFLVIVGLEVAFNLGARGLVGGPQAVGWRLGTLERFAFSAEIFDWMRESGRWPIEHVMRFVSYPFVHASFTHALFAGVMLLALGKMVGEAMGSFAVLLIFFVSAAGGALVYALTVGGSTPLIGAFPAVYGLIGGFTYLLWLRLGQLGEKQVRAFTLIGFLLAIQLIFGLLFGANAEWVADLAGFAIGFVMSTILVPGGWARLVDRLRQRN